MLVTLSGMVMLVRLVHKANASPPMVVTLSGMVILVRLVQLENAATPMLVTLSGMVMLVRLVQLEKAEGPMPITVYPLYVAGIISSVSVQVPIPMIMQVRLSSINA